MSQLPCLEHDRLALAAFGEQDDGVLACGSA